MPADQASFAFERIRRKDPERFTGHTLFVGLIPDEQASARASEIAQGLVRRYDLSRNLRPKSILHVSLNKVGRYERMPEDIAFQAAESLCAINVPPFEVMFDRVGSLINNDRQPLALYTREPNMALAALANQVAAALMGTELIVDTSRKFLPHMTLLWDGATVPEQLLDTPVRWTAREFFLVHSLVGQTEYEYLWRWPLLE